MSDVTGPPPVMSIVRPRPYAPFVVQNHNMKKHIALGLVASTLFLAGCCTAHQAKHWEYMQVRGLQSDANLNKLADEGWSVVAFTETDTGQRYILRRAK